MSGALRHAGPVEPGQETEPRPEPPQMGRGGGSDVIVDSLGRKIKLRPEIGFLDELDILALAGPRANVESWINTVMVAVRVARIEYPDGQVRDFSIPRNDVTLRALLQAVGREGLYAIVEHLAPEPDRETADAIADLRREAESQVGN